MPSPLRIKYENAFYHVMNRGRNRQTIFHDNRYYDTFLDTLDEAHRRFQGIVHAYCLMESHYHLLIETPRPNLSRIVRNINGVYTRGTTGSNKSMVPCSGDDSKRFWSQRPKLAFPWPV